ncbi:MAG: hypothetical protein Q7T61_02360 [Caulobacter sp.]|nr:hypothetical protein [Caulobacter sp.]
MNASRRAVAGTWSAKSDVYHACQATLIPRLPLAGSLAGVLSKGPPE